jgi:hypothetical protein
MWNINTPLPFIYLLTTFTVIITNIHFNLDYNKYVSGAIKIAAGDVLVAIMFWARLLFRRSDSSGGLRHHRVPLSEAEIGERSRLHLRILLFSNIDHEYRLGER